jgi:predicted dehydrogenase|tara:strand:- start:515 stop:1456 length:942 start_codon:yes stop_codon:yes gene_type:complete
VTNLRTAVLGAGHLGTYHAEKYSLIENVDLVAVCDIDQSAGQSVALKHGAAFIADYRELLGKIDAVTIATDTCTHFELARFFLENGVHVLVEKPMTTTSKEAHKLTVIAEANDLRLQVGHIERFNPALLSARKQLGKVQFIECHRLAPFKGRGADVDVVLDLMIHDLDVILSLVEGTPCSVSAVGISVLTNTADIANARIEFSNGAIANVTASRVSTSVQRKFRVFHEGQYLSIDFGEGELQLVVKAGKTGNVQDALKEERWSLEKGDALLAETQAFIDAIRNGGPCQVSGHDGVMALELAEKIILDMSKRAR